MTFPPASGSAPGSMPAHQVENWLLSLLRYSGNGNAVYHGDFPPELKKKCASLGLYPRHIPSLERFDSDTAGKTWILRGVTGRDATDTLPQAAKRYRPRRLFFELASTENGARTRIESAFFEAGYRKSAHYHRHVEFNDNCDTNGYFCFERMPEDSLAEFANSHGFNQVEAKLHRDMLRDTGRRADAHTMRYHWAAQYIRTHDVVLDAACGLGYGSHILSHNSGCARVVGIDNSDYAVHYAQNTYASSRVEFICQDATDLSRFADRSVHAVVSFETLEHLKDPAVFLRECKRVLIPGGRFICSVPNNWVDETGNDPNPYHFHVYTKKKLLQQLSEFFIVDHVFAEKAGNGFRKFSDNIRALFEVNPTAPEAAEEAEWWLAVGIKDPVGAEADDYKPHFHPELQLPGTNLGAYGRDYENPWLVYSLVNLGTRPANPKTLQDLAQRVRAESTPDSADRGAALCVLGYQQLDAEADSIPPELIASIEAYLLLKPGNPHQLRWKVSLSYLLGQIHLRMGQRQKAKDSFWQCAQYDCLAFSPTLGTKIIEAFFLHGWLLQQEGQIEPAAESWTKGMREGERIVSHIDWSEVRGREDLPHDWGYVEIMGVLQKTQQCAFALFSLRSGTIDSGQFFAEVIHTFSYRNNFNQDRLRSLQSRIQDQFKNASSSQLDYIRMLEKELEKKNQIIQKIQRKLSVPV